MFRELQRQLAPAGLMLLWLSLLTGLAYPLAVTGLGQALFPHQAQGSLILKDGKPVGSELVGQAYSDLGHFWSRPSATTPQPYNAAASSGSNLGPSNPALAEAVAANLAALRAAHGEGLVPAELATASASGLDPHVSPAAAMYQVRRVAAARGLGEKEVEALVRSLVEERFLGIWGEPRVNVLRLNLALDALPKTR
jgi:potassium-transporting ATPase KdpC subunit